MTSEMQLPESEATLDEAEHNKRLEETWQSLGIHGVSPNKGGFYIFGHAPQFDVRGKCIFLCPKYASKD